MTRRLTSRRGRAIAEVERFLGRRRQLMMLAAVGHCRHRRRVSGAGRQSPSRTPPPSRRRDSASMLISLEMAASRQSFTGRA